MRYDELSDLQMDLLSARLLGHKAKLLSQKLLGESRTDVEITDNKGDDAIVDSRLWNPSDDEQQINIICAVTGIQAFEAGRHSWMAGMPNPRMTVYGNNRHQAVLKCFIKSVYPNQIPDMMLEPE